MCVCVCVCVEQTTILNISLVHKEHLLLYFFSLPKNFHAKRYFISLISKTYTRYVLKIYSISNAHKHTQAAAAASVVVVIVIYRRCRPCKLPERKIISS